MQPARQWNLMLIYHDNSAKAGFVDDGCFGHAFMMAPRTECQTYNRTYIILDTDIMVINADAVV